MKCQKCPKQATLHITEVLGEDRYEEHHLCEECAHEYLYEPQPKKPGEYKIVGQPLRREDIAPKVYCQQDYVTDVKVPGILVGAKRRHGTRPELLPELCRLASGTRVPAGRIRPE